MGLGAAEIAVLVILAVVLFGPEKLPGIARKAARVLRYVRTIANDATGQIRRELGPEYSDFDVRDLNPRTFVAKHLLSDVEPIVADVKKELEGVDTLGRTTSRDVKKALNTDRNSTNGRSGSGSPSGKPSGKSSSGKSPSGNSSGHPKATTGTKAEATVTAATGVAAAGTQVAVAERPDPAADPSVALAAEAAVPWDHEAT